MLVVVLTAIALRSILLGLAAVAPLAIGIMATAALMAAAGVPFDALSVMVASLAIGIGIDDALHLLVWYKRERNHGAGREQAMRAAVAHAGCPILVTSGAIWLRAAGAGGIDLRAGRPVRAAAEYRHRGDHGGRADRAAGAADPAVSARGARAQRYSQP